MNTAYHALNTCLDHLRKMEFNHMQKLRIEIQLIQVKRLMLSIDWDLGKENRATAEILSFHSEFFKVCSSGVTAETTDTLMALVSTLEDKLSILIEAAGKR